MILGVFYIYAVDFSFFYNKGDKFRVLSVVDEYIYVNRRLEAHTDIFNRIAFTVEDEKDGSGYLVGTFETSERPRGSASSYTFLENYDSAFWRSKKGMYTISEKYYMPVVRNVPVFPDKDLNVGDTWTSTGEERHDFRQGYGIAEPYKIPFNAIYTYDGTEEYQGKTLDRILVSYTLFYTPKKPSSWTITYPVEIMGYSNQRILWDRTLGMLISYTEQFRFVHELANGITIEYAGTAKADIIEAQKMDKVSMQNEVNDALKNVNDVSVTKTDEGLVISLDNIQFYPDSAVLVDTEKAKLAVIANILKKYPDRDILVSGHTALAGTEADRMTLSVNRAKTVADYLISLGTRKAERVSVKGFGAQKPLSDNSTEAGKAKNRRVEITILEN